MAAGKNWTVSERREHDEAMFWVSLVPRLLSLAVSKKPGYKASFGSKGATMAGWNESLCCSQQLAHHLLSVLGALGQP